MSSEQTNTDEPTLSKANNQYLTFMIDKDEFGVDILSVQEIHGWIEPRPLPDSPEFIKGVIDWRNVIVPIIDLRLRFKYAVASYDKTTVVIILKTKLADSEESCVVGIVVDAVSDVHDLNREELRDAPDMGNKIDTQYIKGIAKASDSMIVILEPMMLANLSL